MFALSPQSPLFYSLRPDTHMKVTFLGTGTSVGIPVIGCACAVCTSVDPRNRRLRAGLHVEADGLHLVIDTPPDFRQQALTYRIPRVDSILFTHAHADHIFGLDDMRRFNTIQDAVIPAFASAASIADLSRVFNYIRLDKVQGEFRPRIEFREVQGPFRIGDIDIQPLDVEHGRSPTLGFLIASAGRTFGYVPDCHGMQDATVEALAGIDVMVLDALRHRPHATHLTVQDSVALLERIGARRSYLTHMCHDLDHAETERQLPDSIRLSYDGQVLEW